MINNLDRSGWFGASDTSKVCASNRSTKSWIQWWSVKLGETESTFGNIYTSAGQIYEHPILKAISEDMNLDRQIKVENLLLRVNYDGDSNGIIYEVKTHKSCNEFEVSKDYWRQAQVEMYTYRKMYDKLELPKFKKLYIVSYPLLPDEYYVEPEEVKIDFSRIKFTEISYDDKFIKSEYLPKLKELSKALKKGVYPI